MSKNKDMYMEFKEDEKEFAKNSHFKPSGKWQIVSETNLPKKLHPYVWINNFTGEDGLRMEVKGQETDVYKQMKMWPDSFIFYYVPHPNPNHKYYD